MTQRQDACSEGQVMSSDWRHRQREETWPDRCAAFRTPIEQTGAPPRYHVAAQLEQISSDCAEFRDSHIECPAGLRRDPSDPSPPPCNSPRRRDSLDSGMKAL